jgi:alkylation response protein AidB-like acyl-CoA dehydrogenase
MKAALSREEESFAEEARTWLNEHLVGEFAAHRGAGGPADDDAWDVRIGWERELAAGGWLGISWPAEYGGRGGTVRQEIIFALEAARLNPPYRASVQGLELLGPMLLGFGSHAQKCRFLPRILAVDESWAQGFSEPGAGSDLAAVRTRARLDGAQWILDGQKIWTSIGARADWLYVLARSESADPAGQRHRGLSMLLVPVAQDGVTITPIRNLCGTAEFCATFLDGARTDADLVVGAPGDGWRVTLGALGTERGVSLAVQQLRFVHEVERLAQVLGSGLPVGPVVRLRLADAWASAKVAQWQALRLVELAMTEGSASHLPSAAKVFASAFHQRLGSLTLDSLGAAGQLVGPGYELDELQRTSLAALAESIYGGTTQIQLNLLAERALGLPR